MHKYPKIIMDETKVTPNDMMAKITTEQYADILHHTHKVSDLIDDASEKEEVVPYDDTELRELLKNKVDIVEGKSLVDDVEIERLAGLDNYDDTELRKDLDEVVQDLYNKIMGITDEDSTTVDEAYDTLKEVSKYIKEDGSAAANILNDIKNILETLKNKVDVVEGKSLVDDAEIVRLAGLNNYDDAELRELLKNKVDAVNGKSLLDDAEIERLSKLTSYDDTEIKNELSYITTVNNDKFSTLNERIFDLESKERFEIGNLPEGAVVSCQEKEIRVLCPANTEWTLHSNVGENGNANMRYMSFKAYAPKGAVSFKEGDRGVIVDKMFTFDDSFAGTDADGRNYSICWLALASFDGNNWTYFGKNSSAKKYIGWDYVVEWYDADGKLIATDSIRINLSNEDCHLVNDPYYVSKLTAAMNELSNYDDTEIKESIKNINQYDKETAKSDLVADNYIDMRGEPYFNEELNCFFANGVPVTVEEDPNNSNGVIIKWGVNGSVTIADSSKLYVYGGGDGYVTPKYIPRAKVTVNSGYVRCLYAGGCGNSVVDRAEVIINGGTVKNIMGGGRASDTRDNINRSSVVYDSSIVMNGGACDMLVGGSVGLGITENVCIVVNDGTINSYLIAGGSNGAVENAYVTIKGGTVKLFQSTNRGYVTNVEFMITGGTVNNVYCGGETADDVDGTIKSFKCDIVGGYIENLAVGTDGKEPMSIDKITGTINDGVVTNIPDELKNKLQ